MNKMKKFASIATAVLMTACMAAPMTMSLTSSAATTVTLNTPNDLPSGSSISDITAYQIFTGEYTAAVADTSAKLNITGWSDGIDVSAFITALKADDTFKTGETNDFSAVSYDSTKPAVSAQAVADIISKWTDDDTKAQAFAKLAVLNKNGTGTTGTLSGTTVTFGDDTTSLTDGYYVVTCQVSNPDKNTHTAMSLGMLTVLGGTTTGLNIGTGTAKVGLPEIMKKVYENQDTKESEAAASINGYTESDKKWNDVADYCIGDSVPFKLYGTMPQDIANYDHYYYKFTDTLAPQFDAPTSVTIKVNGKSVTTAPTNSDIFTSITTDTTGTIITVTFEDIKEVIKATKGSNASASDVITVEYTAKLNDTAKIGLPGQENKVDLTYSNNPNIAYKPSNNDENSDDTPGTPKTPGTPGTPETPDDSGKPGDNTGTTPEDKVIVFTYEADFTKVDGVTKAPLENVEFKLKNADGEFVTVDADGKVTGWSADGTVIKSGADGTFKIIGLDDGTYTLVETKPLDGYNPIGDTTVIISGGTVNNQEWNGQASSALTSFKYKVGNNSEATGSLDDVDKDGIAEGTIENKKGSSLPGTGGIGTTLFYVGGGAMVAVAGVFLITKKRMGRKED